MRSWHTILAPGAKPRDPRHMMIIAARCQSKQAAGFVASFASEFQRCNRICHGLAKQKVRIYIPSSQSARDFVETN